MESQENRIDLKRTVRLNLTDISVLCTSLLTALDFGSDGVSGPRE